MDLTVPKASRLLAYMESQGVCELTIPMLLPYATAAGIPRPHLCSILSRLEDQDWLVRVRRGVYVMMAAYQQRQREEAAHAKRT